MRDVDGDEDGDEGKRGIAFRLRKEKVRRSQTRDFWWGVSLLQIKDALFAEDGLIFFPQEATTCSPLSPIQLICAHAKLSPIQICMGISSSFPCHIFCFQL